MHNRNFHELKTAISAHLFKCSNAASSWLLVRDIAMSLILAYGVLRLDAVLLSMNCETAARQLLKYVCLSCPLDGVVSVLTNHNQICAPGLISLQSWWFQGLVLTGIWVIGHEVRVSHIRMGRADGKYSAAMAHSSHLNVFVISLVSSVTTSASRVVCPYVILGLS